MTSRCSWVLAPLTAIPRGTPAPSVSTEHLSLQFVVPGKPGFPQLAEYAASYPSLEVAVQRAARSNLRCGILPLATGREHVEAAVGDAWRGNRRPTALSVAPRRRRGWLHALPQRVRRARPSR